MTGAAMPKTHHCRPPGIVRLTDQLGCCLRNAPILTCSAALAASRWRPSGRALKLLGSARLTLRVGACWKSTGQCTEARRREG